MAQISFIIASTNQQYIVYHVIFITKVDHRNKVISEADLGLLQLLLPLTIITKRSILDVAAALDPPLNISGNFHNCVF